MSDRNEQIRLEILTQCFGYRPGSRDAEQLARHARREGDVRDATTVEMEREAAYLQGKGLLELAPYEIGQGHKRWAITAKGVDYFEAQGWA